MMRELFLRRWPTRVTLGVCLLLGALGYFLGYRASSHGFSTPVAKSTALAGPSVSSAPIATEADPAAVPLEAWEVRWEKFFGQANTPARNRELAALLRDLAKTDPQRALALARSVADWRLRDLLRDAALRGWASVAPDAAGDWALTLRPEDRRAAVEAVMQGAAENPREAVRVALRLCAADPAPAGDYGHYTIAALVNAGAFEDAVRFGHEVGTEKYPFLLKSAFFQWARNQPDQAIAGLDNISDPVLRSKAYSEVISGWAWADPKGLAQQALTLPAGSERTQALAEALPRWVEKDPAAAMEWINRFDAGSDFDAGVVAMANLQSLIQQQPATSMGLASNISDAAERSHTMRAVFRQWATNDPAAARRFVDSTANAADRAILISELNDLSP